MAGVVVQPALDSAPAEANGQSKVHLVPPEREQVKKRSSSFSLNYFEEEEEATVPVNKEEPPKPLQPKLPSNIEQTEVPQNNPPATPLPSQQDTSTTPPMVDPEEVEDPPTTEAETPGEESSAVGGEDLMCLFTPDSFPHLKELALDGKLNNTNMRGITWRVSILFLFHLVFIIVPHSSSPQMTTLLASPLTSHLSPLTSHLTSIYMCRCCWGYCLQTHPCGLSKCRSTGTST